MKSLFTLACILLSACLFGQQQIELCEGNQTTYTYYTNSGEVGQYVWFVDSNAIGVSNTISIDWFSFPIGSHTLSVEFISDSGCAAQGMAYQILLTECQESSLYVPNSFTPNGDGLNETWFPAQYNNKRVEFWIFNRWGEELYYSTNQGWDGTYQSQPCQVDVYVYIVRWIDLDNRWHQEVGQVNLVR
jgi:gliding motility-associated-like protein